MSPRRIGDRQGIGYSNGRRATLGYVNRQSACARWIDARATDRSDGTEGVLDHYVREVTGPAASDSASLFAQLEERLLRYDIFPPVLMRAEVCSEDGKLREGTTIVQRVAVGPFTLEAAVRVVEVWHVQDAHRTETGFTYVTLEGHPERGASSFRLSRSSGGPIVFSIDARSRPGSLLTRVGRPFARRFQRRATDAAMAYFVANQ